MGLHALDSRHSDRTLHALDRCIGGVIAARALDAGRCAALVGPGFRDVLFGELADSIATVAAQLGMAGLNREDRVGLLVPPGVPGGQLVVALASNIALVPLNPALTASEMTELAKATRLGAVVIPKWLDAPARDAMLEQGLTAFEAVLTPEGSLSLERLTPAPHRPAILRPARDTDIALLLRSSGTTGVPKQIAVTHGNLLAMSEKLGSDMWFGLTPHDRAACTLPLFYAAGLKTTLFVPLLLGASVGFPPAGRAFDIAEWFEELKPTYLSVSPGWLNGFLDRLKASPRTFEARTLRFVMCAAAYLPEPARLAAERLLHVPVLEFYGLSEAGVMAANPVPPGRVKPGTVGLPAPGELLVVNRECDPVARGEVGQIMIAGPTVTPGYLGASDSEAAQWRDGWLLTGDLGRIDEDGYLTIVGRVKELINRGGEKVFPYEVEKAMLEHPAVLEAAAFGVPHPRLGESVAAAAVLKPGAIVSEQELKSFLAARLAPYKLPRRVSWLQRLPRGATGKVLRSALTQAATARAGAMVQPDRLLEWELRDLWSRLLNTSEIGIDDDFFDIGGDSLLATEMLIDVEGLTGQPYPHSELSTLTIRHMTEVLMAGLAAENDLITQVKSGTGMPLFFCHGDYVTRGMFAHKLASLLPRNQPVFLLNCNADGTAASSVEQMAGLYLQEVLRVAGDSPILIAGYCNGGLAAWHLTHLLRSKGVQVAELLLIETMSLNARPLVRSVAALAKKGGTAMRGRAGPLVRNELTRAAWSWSRRLASLTYRTMGSKLSSALRRKPDPGLRGDAFDILDDVYFRLMSAYVPPRIDVGVSCFIAEEGRHFDTDPSFWRSLAPSVQVTKVPGTHHTALISQRQALAAALANRLASVNVSRAQVEPTDIELPLRATPPVPRLEQTTVSKAP
jgi:oxalate---CoA ligase